jgi:hypothetical protein
MNLDEKQLKKNIRETQELTDKTITTCVTTISIITAKSETSISSTFVTAGQTQITSTTVSSARTTLADKSSVSVLFDQAIGNAVTPLTKSNSSVKSDISPKSIFNNAYKLGQVLFLIQR